MMKKYLVLGLTMLLAAGPRVLAQGLGTDQGTAAREATPQPETAQAAQPQPRHWKFPWEKDQAQQAPMPAANGPGQAVALRNGDTVDIRIANVPAEDVQQFSATYTLDETGMINLPYIGMIKAGGMPPSQVQIVIQNKLISDGIYTNPTVTVNPPVGMRFISVGGAVRAPGRVPYTSDLTLMSTINAAGGASDFAGDKIRLIRGGKAIFFSRKKLDKTPSLDPQIEPGDQVEIVESAW